VGQTRILFISRAVGEGAGGMERLSFELAEALRTQPYFFIKVLSWPSHPKQTLTWSRLQSAVFALAVIPRALWQQRGFHIVYLGDPVLSLVGWALKKFCHQKIAVTVHGLDISYASVIYRWYLRAFFRHFDLYLPISSAVKSLLADWGVSARTTVIPPGIHDRFNDRSIRRHQLDDLLGQSTTKQHVLLTNGRLVKRKGHAWFVRYVLPHLPSTCLYVIAGSGSEYNNIVQTSRDAQVSRQVKMLGRVSDEELKILYNTADIFVQPNVPVPDDIEGFGLVVLEAALCEMPVFAAAIDGIPEAIQDGRNGILLPSGDAQAWRQAIIKEISASSAHSSGRPYTLDRFSWKKVTGEYIRALAQLGHRPDGVRQQ
jgi:phosphatidyl-myo-inositol dimannoside synthase